VICARLQYAFYRAHFRDRKQSAKRDFFARFAPLPAIVLSLAVTDP
jgi:hypothetical protein